MFALNSYSHVRAVRYIHKCTNTKWHTTKPERSLAVTERADGTFGLRFCCCYCCCVLRKFVLKTQSRLLYYIFTKASDISTFAVHVFICVHECVLPVNVLFCCEIERDSAREWEWECCCSLRWRMFSCLFCFPLFFFLFLNNKIIARYKNIHLAASTAVVGTSFVDELLLLRYCCCLQC